MLKLTIDDVM